MPVRVVLAEDSYLVREGIAKLLDADDGVDLVASCGDLDALFASVEDTSPDVVVTDIRMPPSGTDEGIRAASFLREARPEIGVVVLSQYLESSYALALLRDGSERRAYLLKERVSHADQLSRAVREVAAGGSFVDAKVVESLVAARQRGSTSPLARLTPREREILFEMAQGRNNAAIASALVITERAVEKHINSIFSKLDLSEEPEVHRRVKAVLLFLADRES